LVTDKLIEMYQQAGAPLKTIHFGGDEVPSGVWEKSASVMALKLKEPAIKTTADLWNYFFDRIGLMLAKKNLYISGWEETALMKIDVDGKKKWVPNPMFANRNFHVDVWNNLTGNEDLAYRLANSGYPVILSFVTNYYFDLAYDRSFNEHGFYWGGFINLEKSFKFIPFDYLKNQSVDYMNRPFSKETLQDSKKLTSSGRKNILGIQGLLWSETVTTPDRLEYMYLPRLLALAERAWTKEPEWMTEANSAKAGIDYESDWTKFGFSLGRELERLDIYGGGYHYRIPTPAFKIENGLVYANTDVPDFILRYTKDGSEPNSKSKLYRSGHPIPYGGSMVLRAFNRFGRGGNTVRVNASNYPK
jgi:hexosaminidase